MCLWIKLFVNSMQFNLTMLKFDYFNKISRSIYQSIYSVCKQNLFLPHSNWMLCMQTLNKWVGVAQKWQADLRWVALQTLISNSYGQDLNRNSPLAFHLPEVINWLLLPMIYTYYPANSKWEYSNLSGRSCYLDPTPNSCNQFIRKCVSARGEN